MRSFMFIFFVVMAFLIAGCESLPKSVAPVESQDRSNKALWNWKADIALNVNGVQFDGMGSTQLPGPINIELVSKAKLDVLIISSCQRYVSYEKLDKGWFGGAGKKFTYTYSPSPTELAGKCPLYFQAFDKDGLTAWGLLAFKYDEKLPATVECNGQTYVSNGFTTCQSKNGFEQVMRFDKDVIFEADSSCNAVAISKRQIKVVPSLGFCNITFTDGVNYHAAVFLGYQSAMIRGE